MEDQHFDGVDFDAQFAMESPVLQSMEDMHGVDGFSLSVDPLYKVSVFAYLLHQ